MKVNLMDLSFEISIIKIVFLSICTSYTFFRIINKKSKTKLIIYISCILIAIVTINIKEKTNSLISTVFLILMLSFACKINSKEKIGYSIIVIAISLAINYIIFFISTIIIFVLNKIIHIENDIINLILMMFVHVIDLLIFCNIKRLKYGIIFLQRHSNNEYFDIMMLNISTSILVLIIIISNKQLLISRDLVLGLIIFSIIMFITIQKSLQLYYKQKLLVKELDETKEELENTKKELKQVEEENLNFSKKSHTLAHRQKSLEHKIEELTAKAEISAEEAGEVKDRLKEIEKDLYKETATVELSKTEIPEIDDMLKYMQSECIKNKIEFELQLTGNIYHMLNNLISKEDLEILLADHIKDAIIAINHSDNINRSILVRLGEIDGIYSLYIYDSGVEFEKETLENLGKKPSTTHADEGGTGMGFMNTFDTLRKYEASLTINELDKPNKDNYTKVLIFKFDKKNEFKIISYRQEELN